MRALDRDIVGHVIGIDDIEGQALDHLGGMCAILTAGDQGDRARFYEAVGISGVYKPQDNQVVLTTAPVGHMVRVGGPERRFTYRPLAARRLNYWTTQRGLDASSPGGSWPRTYDADQSVVRSGIDRLCGILRGRRWIEEGGMAGLVRKSLDAPEETRPFEDGKGKLELVNLESGGVGRATFEPGWQWSKHVKPIAGTDSCEASHMGYFISGRMKVVMDDGEEMEFGPGDFAVMAPGHDAWTVGDEPCIVIDWQGFADYAKR